MKLEQLKIILNVNNKTSSPVLFLTAEQICEEGDLTLYDSAANDEFVLDYPDAAHVCYLQIRKKTKKKQIVVLILMINKINKHQNTTILSFLPI